MKVLHMGFKVPGFIRRAPESPDETLLAIDQLDRRIEDLQDAVVGMQYKLDVSVALLSALLSELRERPEQQPMIVVPRLMMGEKD